MKIKESFIISSIIKKRDTILLPLKIKQQRVAPILSSSIQRIQLNLIKKMQFFKILYCLKNQTNTYFRSFLIMILELIPFSILQKIKNYHKKKDWLSHYLERMEERRQILAVLLFWEKRKKLLILVQSSRSQLRNIKQFCSILRRLASRS